MSNYVVPRWFPTAIPTQFGWANPKTGEILIAIRNLENPVKGFIRNRPYVVPEIEPENTFTFDNTDTVVEDVFIDISTTTDQLQNDEPVLVEPDIQPKKRRGRPAKKS